MAERIRQLEEALSVAHAKTSTEVHVLLGKSEDLQGETFLDQGNQNNVQNDVIDAFGTLSIGSDGRSKYHNQSAGADVCKNPLFAFSETHYSHILLIPSSLVLCRGNFKVYPLPP